MLLAHGVGVRADLPVPLSYALIGGAVAVLASFLALGLLWREPRLRGDAAGRPLPAGAQAVVDSPVLTWLLRAVVLALTLLVVAAGLFGPDQAGRNLAPYAFYITFWVGLVPASLLLGPVWRRVNPLRTLHAGLIRLTGPAPGGDRLPALGYWPAAVSLLVFGWLELAYPERALPGTVAVFLVVYAVVHLIASLWFGEAWFARGDGFEVASTLFGRLSPFGRRNDGRLVVRNPLDGVDGLRPERGLAGVVVVLLGITGYDGVTRTQWWQTGLGSGGDTELLIPTVALLVVVALVGATYAGATALAGRLGGGTDDGPNRFAHSVVPIAVGYAVAHYFSLLLLDGQLTWILLSDPFGTGADYLGTASNAVDLAAVSAGTISVVQVDAIVVGHVLGVVLAHDRALRLAKRAPQADGSTARRARTSQYPLLAVMVALTLAGIGLLLGA
jgi:hypothetical protein